MAMVLGISVENILEKLAEFAGQEVCKVLGVKEEIEKLQRRMIRISSFLEDAERKRHTDVAINTWVKELKDIMYDADDIIDDCMFGGGELMEPPHPSSSSKRPRWGYFNIPQHLRVVNCRREISDRIKELNHRLKEIADDNRVFDKLDSSKQGLQSSIVRSRATSSIQHDPDIVGTQIEDAANDIIEWILEEDDPKQCQVYGIVGMAGIGKTTLARKIYNDERVKAKFDKQIWLYISKNFDEIKLFKELIRGIEGNVGEAESIEELDGKFVSTLRSKHKKIFLVLDDLWSANIWNNQLKTSIESSGVISKILITSRDANVGRAMGATGDHIHHVKKIDGEDGWELLKKIVFSGGDEKMMPMLKDVGTKILDKCDGLPLAIRVIAGTLLRKKKTQREWEIVLESDLWQKIDDEIPGALYLSYEDLPSHLKICFLSCVLFKGSIDAFRLVRFWMAEGFIAEQPKVLMEESGEGYYEELVSRNLLQSDPNSRGESSRVMCFPYSEGKSSFVMHDLLRALAINLTEGEIMLSEGETSKSNNSLTKIRRLSMSNKECTLIVPSIIIEQKCLRVLLVRNWERINGDTLKILRRLRVLDLSWTSIKSIPNSIGELLYLKCLYLDRTYICELPESIGDLMNLQTLSMQECRLLFRLPNSITRLCNLRCLCFESISYWYKGILSTYVPKGIGKLTNINHLDGFMVGCDDSSIGVGCDLEELQCLSKLRFLRMHGLRRASSREGATVLKDKSYLKSLFIDWNTRSYCCIDREATSDTAETIQKAESVCSQLSPPSPSHLEHLGIYNFPGRRFPDWIMSTSLVDSFPCLAYITISEIQFCTELPPLGQLPQLKYLKIDNALSIKKIGPEFLGCHGSSGFPAFPKLDCLEFSCMMVWEEWELCVEQEEEVGDQRNHLELFPNLTKCLFADCIRLIALPEAFYHATNLKDLRVLHCHSLKRISSLPPLKSLSIQYCRSLEHVENADLPEALYTGCRTDSGLLPQWLLDLLMKCNHQSQHSLREFQMRCDLPLLKSCLKGKPYWHIIEQIPKVHIQFTAGNFSEILFDEGPSMRYIKDPPHYDITDPSNSLH